MPSLSIPEKDRNGLAVLSRLPDPAFATAIIELERAPDSIPAVPNLSPKDAEDLKGAIDSMYAVRAYADVPLDEFLGDICDALSVDGQVQITPAFRERLSRVLSIDALNVGAKAALLQNEFEHDFCDARIMTDARPIYGDDPSVPPTAMIITHTLRVTFHGSGGRLNEVYFSLGSRDLRKLRDVLDRAERKAASFKTALSPSGIRLIDPQHE